MRIPMGEQVSETDKICKKCEVIVCEKEFPTDLISLPINGYDMILGMDWLSKYYVQIDCKTKDINLCILGEPTLRLNFKKPQGTLGLILWEQAKKLLMKWVVGYITYIVNQPKEKAQVKQVSVMKEFPDVFSEGLDTLPQNGEVEFVVNLLSGVVPIFKTLYQMAHAKLQELKEQLQDLLK